MIAHLQSLGFTPGDLNDLFDKDRPPPPYVTYLTRQWRDDRYKGHPHLLPPFQHQYLTLTSYKGRFIEACLLVCEKPRDTRAKKQPAPLYANLLRSLDEIVHAVSAVCPIPPSRP